MLLSLSALKSPARQSRLLALAVLGWFAAAPAHACPFPPPAVHDVTLMNLDGDDVKAALDTAVLSSRKRNASPVRDYLNTVIGEADVSFVQETESLSTYRAKCAVEWLEVWARGDALLGAAVGPDAVAERRGALSGAAIAYLKVKPSASPEQSGIIEAWLTKLAVTAQFDMAEMEAGRSDDRYWLGLALGATATATQNQPMWTTARTILEAAVKSIGADGILPRSSQDKPHALKDQAAALVPLMALAELARARGEDVYQLNDGALHRLAKTTIQGIDEPESFAAKIGVPQAEAADPQAGWLALYALVNPETATMAKFEMPSSHPWLGGNVLLLDAALAKNTGK